MPANPIRSGGISATRESPPFCVQFGQRCSLELPGGPGGLATVPGNDAVELPNRSIRSASLIQGLEKPDDLVGVDQDGDGDADQSQKARDVEPRGTGRIAQQKQGESRGCGADHKQ